MATHETEMYTAGKMAKALGVSQGKVKKIIAALENARGKGAVAVIDEESIHADVGGDQIRKAVLVPIAGCTSDGVARFLCPGGLGDVTETSVCRAIKNV